MLFDVPNQTLGGRCGLGTSWPPQFGHTCFTPAAHVSQKVHSYEQINASPSSASDLPHRSHRVRISNAIVSLSEFKLSFEQFVPQPTCAKRIQLLCRRPKWPSSKRQPTSNFGQKYCRIIATFITLTAVRIATWS